MSTIEEAREQAREALAQWDAPGGNHSGQVIGFLASALRALLDATEPRPITDERTPEFEAIEQELFKHQPVLSMSDGHIAGCQCLDRVFQTRTEDWGTHLAEVFEHHNASRPITDEMVEAAAGADFEFGKESMTWDAWAAHDSDHAGWLRKKARAALEAAEEARR